MKKFPIENVNSVIITALPRIVAYLRIAKRYAKGIESAGHLIHRGAVPLTLEGKDLTPLKVGETANVGRFFK